MVSVGMRWRAPASSVCTRWRSSAGEIFVPPTVATLPPDRLGPLPARPVMSPAAKASAMTPSTMKVTTTPALELMIRRKKLSMEWPIVPERFGPRFRGAVPCHQARGQA